MKRKIRWDRVMFPFAFVLMIWFMASFFDTNAHNLSDGQFHAWNLFTILF